MFACFQGERIETRYLSKDGYFYGIPFLGDLTGKGMGQGFFFGEFAKKGCNKRAFAKFSSTVRQSHGGVTGKFEGFIVLFG